MKPDDPRHGTHAGAQQHRKDGETPCDPCRYAANAYIAQLRDTTGNAKGKAYNHARNRAIRRLIAHHRAEYTALLAEERRYD